MIALNVIYTVKEGKMDEVLRLLARMKDLVKAKEPGCVLYQVSKSQSDENILLLYEVYKDQLALDAHGNTGHFEEIVKKEVVPRLESRVRTAFDVTIE
ncbi:putative quinol monooxygenase [Mesorhizobium sp. ZC-5]|jgi:autoinducer 2-degrading protein|uniref:putative quinol monooxygenase n=1 Tax=Mesorhizobium sp. ZC-5 TaxID=2986066 RepID=UPI0021E8B3EC|nr:antibiotic biosynthesis monooxygenase family protein [Mesorhizobium sp. ZC-5]MCV3242864.1 antibiotic biosynthesis monooxygenase [Mesorhizobium sp. ZC-5]